MRVKCLHGYFMFHEESAGELSRFMSVFQGLELVPVDDYYTFSALEDAPDFSLEGGFFLGAPTDTTFAGRPWEVMRENGLVYNLNTGLVAPLESITAQLSLTKAGNYFLSPGLILPGAVMDDGSRVTDYAAWYLFDSGKFKYSEVLGD